MALLTVGYSSVASASTGTVTKEEAAQIQQDIAKRSSDSGAAKMIQRKQVAQAQEKNEVAKKQAVQAQEKNEVAKSKQHKYKKK